jgi:hypothetical protein
LQARVRRLEQLTGGLDADLVRLAMEKETLNADEARVYRESMEAMVQAAKGPKACFDLLADRHHRDSTFTR